MDMIYGISKSKDVLLSSIAGAFDEDTKKDYTIDRLSDNLSNDLSNSIDENYCNLAMDSLGENPVFLIDDSLFSIFSYMDITLNIWLMIVI